MRQIAAGSFVEVRIFSTMIGQLARAVFGAPAPAAVFTATSLGWDVSCVDSGRLSDGRVPVPHFPRIHSPNASKPNDRPFR